MTRLEFNSRIPAAGVYAIQSKSTGKVYVGSSKSLHNRYQMHERSIRVFRSGPNGRFRAAIRELGTDDFEFIVLDLTQFQNHEAFWIHELNALSPENTDSINPIRLPHPNGGRSLQATGDLLHHVDQTVHAFAHAFQVIELRVAPAGCTFTHHHGETDIDGALRIGQAPRCHLPKYVLRRKSTIHTFASQVVGHLQNSLSTSHRPTVPHRASHCLEMNRYPTSDRQVGSILFCPRHIEGFRSQQSFFVSDCRIPAAGAYAIQSRSMSRVYVGLGKNQHGHPGGSGMRPPRFACCRLCGGRWVAIEGVVQRHRPGCLLARPGARHSEKAGH